MPRAEPDLSRNGASAALTVGVTSGCGTVLPINVPDGRWQSSGLASGPDPAVTHRQPSARPPVMRIGARDGGSGVPGQPVVTGR